MDGEWAAVGDDGFDGGGDADLWAGLSGDLRGGCGDEPVRDHAARRERRAHEPGGGRGVDGAAAGAVEAGGLAQSGTAGVLGADAVDADDAGADGGADVSALAGWVG